jgi:hypothetical protein
MRSIPGLRNAAAGVSGIVLAGALLCWGQYISREGGQLTRQGRLDDTPDSNPVWEAKRVKALNAERQKSMISDTEKLVKLARELDAEIASNPTDELTPDELHKVATIEKLAHNVKTKMAQSFGGGPELKPPLVPLGVPGVQ